MATQPLQQQAADPLWRRQVATRFAALPSAMLTGSKTFNPPNIANGAQTTTTIDVPLAALGDFAIASFSLDTQGVTLAAQVTALEVVTVTFRNNTGGAVDLDSGTLAAAVLVV